VLLSWSRFLTITGRAAHECWCLCIYQSDPYHSRKTHSSPSTTCCFISVL